VRGMLYEGEAKGVGNPEKRHGAVSVNRSVTVTCLKRVNRTC
jgi:hypothetical protein